MKLQVLLSFTFLFFFSCKSEELTSENTFPRTEFYKGTSHIKNYILEVFLIDSMYHWVETDTDTMFNDTLQLDFDKIDDDVRLRISYENTEITKSLDESGNYYFFKAPKPTVEIIINFKEDEKFMFKNYFTFPSPDQGGSYGNRKSFSFEGVKL